LTIKYIGLGLVKIFASYSAVIIFGLYITYERNLNVSEIYSLLILFMSIEEPMV
jgi:ABC-type multidrug transport system fused ATPase/permease subunit